MAGKRFYGNDILSTFNKAAMICIALYVVVRRSPAMVNADNLCEELVFPLGYACNDYTVETSDGFLLGIYNIPYGRAGPGTTAGVPVVLFHGFQAAGDNFVANSAQESLGTVLADSGFDVWIANNRNLQWSHGSSKYSEHDDEYWDWTWDELAAHDLPTTVDFVYNKRGGTKLFYVAHSQGTLTFFAASTTKTLTAQLAEQIRGAVLLAPFAYNVNVQSPIIKFIIDSHADEALPALGVGPVNIITLFNAICAQSPSICTDLIYGSLGTNNFLNDTRRAFYLKYFPQVTSSRNLNHFGQTQRSGLFQKYDRGPSENVIKYGQSTPPIYDWSNFPPNIPIQIFDGGLDQLATPADTQRTISSLPPNVVQQTVTIPNYGHVDFILGSRAYLDVYPQVIAFLNSN